MRVERGVIWGPGRGGFGSVFTSVWVLRTEGYGYGWGGLLRVGVLNTQRAINLCIHPQIPERRNIQSRPCDWHGSMLNPADGNPKIRFASSPGWVGILICPERACPHPVEILDACTVPARPDRDSRTGRNTPRG